ncbi:unnamed protein product [Peronospora farinosa]|uniref:Sister chromatid cohesion protein PDS5 n=1 Tax=Peronospora farinosa TaxID=134698 RepID=A0AAV0TN82_9STRA|nr:unnamed protein product [Peronospora farinosa]CAI5724692.1 unnamed protein product [Peronospora farinosa]
MAPRKTRASSSTKHRPSNMKRVLRRRETDKTPAKESKTDVPDSDSDRTQNQISQIPMAATLDIVSGTYLSTAGRTSSILSKRLQETWETLQQTSSHQQQQEDAVLDVQAAEKLNLLATELLQPKLMQHKDKNIQSLVACCLVEIMRVSSPDSPFSCEEELYRVFKLFIDQLSALTMTQTTTSIALHSLYVLESLATVKSCLLVVGLDFTMDEDEEVIMVQFFRALFETIECEKSTKVETLMLNIMVACLEESDDVDQPLLDVILSPLLSDESSRTKSEDDEQRSPSHMARELIRRTSDLLQNPLANFFNNILIDSRGGLGSQKPFKLKEHVYTLIYEVHKINPSLLLYVLPNVCLQLQVDEVATRSDAIALMGKLFASSHADYGHQYMKNFCEFLGRFRDASKDIRLQMIQVCVPIWEHKTDLASFLEKEFMLRLNDPEWEVRQLVVHELCDFAANCLELISEECLRAVGERMKDKKVALRKETMTGLSQVYSTHISSCWALDDEEENRLLSLNHRNIPATHIKKLCWIPDYVLKCYAYPQQELKLRVVQLLDDFLLPKALSDRTRANGLLFIFHSLDATSKEALRRVFIERAKCQDVCKQFVEFKMQHRQKGSATENDSNALENAKEQLYTGLAPLFSDISGLNKPLGNLAKWKDHTVFKHMGELCDFSKNQREIRHARDQLVRCVGSKTPLGEFLKKLCRKLSLLTMNQALVAVLLDFLDLKQGRPSRENRSIVDLVVMASGALPELFAPFIREKVSAILVRSNDNRTTNQFAANDKDEDEEDEEDPVPTDPRVVLGALHVLANYSRHWFVTLGGDDASSDSDDSNTPSAALVKQLHNFCLGDSNVEAQSFNAAKEMRAAELAAFAISHFYGRTEDTMELISKLCLKEKLGLPKHPGVLPALQSLEVFAKRCCHIFSEDRPLFLRLWTHLLDDLISKSDQTSTLSTPGHKEHRQKNSRPAATKDAEVRRLAIKVAVNLVVYCGSARGPSNSIDEGTKLIKLLFGILRSDGTTYASAPTLTAMFRATASCSLIKLMRNRQLEASMSVSEWHLLGFTIQDSNEDVRRRFLKKLASHLMKQHVQYPHKYLSYLALAATDPSTSLKKTARNLLKIGVERMRRIFDAASSRESEVACSPGQSGDNSPGMCALMVPEYALPYAIHLLAHHPAFPVKLVKRTPSIMVLQSALWTDQLMYLRFFLDGLVSANAAAVDNIAFLLQILTKLSQCHDVTNPDDVNIYPLIDSTAVLLKKKIKKQSNLKPFPGKIFLPKHLYSPGRPSTLVTPGRREEPEAPESLGTTAASRLSTSLSPIKPMDFAAHFMKLNSPLGSSLLNSSLKKRKRSFHKDDGSYSDADEMKEDNDDDPRESMATPPRRQSLLGNARPAKRTFADDSSDSGVESDAFSLSTATRPNEPVCAASSLPS